MPTPTPPPPLPDDYDDAERAASRRPSGARPMPRKRKPGLLSGVPPRTLAIGVAVLIVLVLVVVVVAVVAGGGDDKKASSIKVDGAVTVLTGLLDGVAADTDLAACPFGSIADIAADVKGEVAFRTTVADDLQQVVVGGKNSVNEVLCSASTAEQRIATAQTLYVYATPVPKGSYTDYLSKTLLAGVKSKVEPAVKFAGGSVYAFCVTASAAVKGGCGADWVAADSKLVIGLQVDTETVTAAQASAALQKELPTLVARLGGDASTAGDSTTVSTSTTSAASRNTTSAGSTATLATTAPVTGAGSGPGTTGG
jgi:hypothetical protein